MIEQQTIWDKRFSGGKQYVYDTDWIDSYLGVFKSRGYRDILELGCGDGRCAAAMSKAGFNVLATDISIVAIKKVASAMPDVATECVDMSNHLPYDAGSFDAVVSNLSSHYFSSEKTAEIYADVHRVLKPGGIFLLRVNDDREYQINKLNDTVEKLSKNYVLSSNGKRKHYFDTDDLKGCLSCFSNVVLDKGSFRCNGRKKYVLEAVAYKE